MKIFFLILSILVLSALLASAVHANYYAKGYFGICFNDPVTAKKFHQEILPLKDEMISKKFEIRKEYQKDKPDLDKISKLKKDIIDIKTRIHKIGNEMGINFGKCVDRKFDKHCGAHNKWQARHKHGEGW